MRTLALLLLLATSVCASDPAGYSYKRVLTVTSDSANVTTNYPVKVIVDTETSVAAGHMKSDCSDILFQDSTNATQEYWIETPTANTSVSVIWVKVPNVANGNTTTTMYYGNSGVTNNTSGARVFSLFDDFSSGSKLNTNTWAHHGVNATFWPVAGGTLNVTLAGYTYTASVLQYKTAARMRFRVEKTGACYGVAGLGNASSELVVGRLNSAHWTFYDFDEYHDQSGLANSLWHTHEVRRVSATNYSAYVDDTLGLTMTASSTGLLGLYIEFDDNVGSTMTVDWILARPLLDTEPTVSLGSEYPTGGPSSSILKILGVAQSDISRVSGVDNASIKAVLGVANQ